jgi:hypothetical protein
MHGVNNDVRFTGDKKTRVKNGNRFSPRKLLVIQIAGGRVFETKSGNLVVIYHCLNNIFKYGCSEDGLGDVQLMGEDKMATLV